MKKFILIISVSCSLLACQKSHLVAPETIPVNNAPKYKTSTWSGKTTTYEYDGYGRQVKLVESDGSRTETSYSKGKVTRNLFDPSGVLARTITITLNTDGLQSEVIYSDKPGNYTRYEYRSDKMVNKTVSKAGANMFESNHFYSNGNLDSIRYYTNGIFQLTNVYTCHLDQPNVCIPGNDGLMFYGLERSFMLKSLTHVSANGTITPENYSYEYNQAGLMIKTTETTQNGTSQGVFTYY
jgi:YD repeat-containing protein